MSYSGVLEQRSSVTFVPLSREKLRKFRARYFAKAGDDQPRLPDYVINGKIIEVRSTAGKVKQSSYVFQLNLVDTRQDIDAWSGEAQVTKQGTRNAPNSRG